MNWFAMGIIAFILIIHSALVCKTVEDNKTVDRWTRASMLLIQMVMLVLSVHSIYTMLKHQLDIFYK